MPSIKFKSISGKGVKSLVIFQKPTLYAVVSLSSGDKKNKKKTPVDRTNGENPVWDQPMRVVIDSHDPDLILQFDLKAEAILGNRLVGKARIPVADLDFSGSIQHASYQLRTPDGKPNGVLNFSYWIESPGQAAAVLAPVPAPTPVVNYSPPPSAPMVGLYPDVSYPPSAVGLYPDVSYPPSAVGLYPDVSYPPSAPQVRVSASGYYPAVEPVAVYPLPPSGSGYYPTQDSAIPYPPPPVSAAAADYYPLPSSAAGYYPPPGTHIAAYSPPQQCQQVPECCDRSLLQLAPGWGYPPQPAPGWHYPSPASGVYGHPGPDVYGYRQDCWDRGLYGYN